MNLTEIHEIHDMELYETDVKECDSLDGETVAGVGGPHQEASLPRADQTPLRLHPADPAVVPCLHNKRNSGWFLFGAIRISEYDE